MVPETEESEAQSAWEIQSNTSLPPTSAPQAPLCPVSQPVFAAGVQLQGGARRAEQWFCFWRKIAKEGQHTFSENGIFCRKFPVFEKKKNRQKKATEN